MKGSPAWDQRVRKRVAGVLRVHVPDPLEPEIRKGVDILLREYSVGDLQQV